MNEAVLKSLWKVAAAALILLGIAAVWWGPRAAVGVFSGGAWNLANLWCLTRLLAAWLGPQRSTKRVVGWLVVKFPLLYLLVFQLLRHPAMSIVAFGVGFTIVLLTAVTFLAVRAREMFGVASAEHPPCSAFRDRAGHRARRAGSATGVPEVGRPTADRPDGGRFR